MSICELRGASIDRRKPGSIPRRRRHRQILSGYIARKLTLAVFVSLLVIGAVAAIPGYDRLHAHFTGDVRTEAQRLVQAAIDPRTFPTLTRLVAIGEHLVRTSDIVGGTYVTGIGEERASFGEPPELSWARARLEGEGQRLLDNNATFEMFFGPEITGVSYGLLVRVDSAKAWAATQWRFVEIVLLAIIVSAGLAITTGLLAQRFVSQPLQAIDGIVKAALNDPENAALARCPHTARDELGLLSRDIEQLLFALSQAYGEELPAAYALAERNPHGILTFSQWGHLLTANAAALRMFGVDDAAELAARDPGCVFRFDGNPTTGPKLLKDGPAFGPGEIIRANATIPCLVAGDAMRGPDGSAIRYFVMFVDMTRMVSDMREQVALRQKADRERRQVEEELSRLRNRFEACLVLLEPAATPGTRPRPVTVNPRDLIAGWLEKAVTRGAMGAGGAMHDELPLLRGDPGELRRLFDAALETVRLRSGDERPTIVVTATTDENESGQFTFRAANPDGGRPFAAIASEEDVSLFLAAAAALARREGGQLLMSQVGDNGNGVILRLPLDRDTYSVAEAAADTAA